MFVGVTIGVLGALNLVQLWVSLNLLNKILMQAKVGPILTEKDTTFSVKQPEEKKRGKLAFSMPVLD